jgi:hypothetical protein
LGQWYWSGCGNVTTVPSHAAGVRAPPVVLVIRPGALGDAVLTLPALVLLRAAGVRRLILLGTPASWSFLAPGTGEVSVRDFGDAAWLGLFAPDLPLSPSARAILS